jgi:hypothetical protein
MGALDLWLRPAMARLTRRRSCCHLGRPARKFLGLKEKWRGVVGTAREGSQEVVATAALGREDAGVWRGA